MNEDTKILIVVCVTFVLCMALFTSCEKYTQLMKAATPIQVK